MRRDGDATAQTQSPIWRPALPGPTPEFRRRAWRAFQQALNPLGPPRPLRTQRQR